MGKIKRTEYAKRREEHPDAEVPSKFTYDYDGEEYRLDKRLVECYSWEIYRKKADCGEMQEDLHCCISTAIGQLEFENISVTHDAVRDRAEQNMREDLVDVGVICRAD